MATFDLVRATEARFIRLLKEDDGGTFEAQQAFVEASFELWRRLPKVANAYEAIARAKTALVPGKQPEPGPTFGSLEEANAYLASLPLFDSAKEETEADREHSVVMRTLSTLVVAGLLPPLFDDRLFDLADEIVYSAEFQTGKNAPIAED